jgi:hypothetical protein
MTTILAYFPDTENKYEVCKINVLSVYPTPGLCIHSHETCILSNSLALALSSGFQVSHYIALKKGVGCSVFYAICVISNTQYIL